MKTFEEINIPLIQSLGIPCIAQDFLTLIKLILFLGLK